MFKPHIGDCIKCSRKGTPIVVKAGFCQWCNHENKQEKKKKEGKSTAKYVYVKPNTGESQIFLDVWTKSDQRCRICKEPILYPISANFAHILSKSLNKFPLFKLREDNIWLMCYFGNKPGCHYVWDNTPHDQLTDAMWKEALIKESDLKEEYKHYKNVINNKNA